MKTTISYLEFDIDAGDLLLVDEDDFDAEEYAADLAADWIGETVEIDDPEENLADYISDATGFLVKELRYEEA